MRGRERERPSKGRNMRRYKRRRNEHTIVGVWRRFEAKF